jgi:hypothetical protein
LTCHAQKRKNPAILEMTQFTRIAIARGSDRDDWMAPMNKVKSFSTGFGLITIVTGLLFGTLPRNWIELFFRADPDGGNGILELFFALVLIALGGGIVLYAIKRFMRTKPIASRNS